LGDSNIALQQDPISWEKLHKLLLAPINRILGLILNLRRMAVSTPPEFSAATVHLVRMMWGPHHHTLNVREAKELTGN
jgi:hypothetical protein